MNVRDSFFAECGEEPFSRKYVEWLESKLEMLLPNSTTSAEQQLQAKISAIVEEWENLPGGMDYLYGVDKLFKKLRKLSTHSS